jgi:hypothetical protein
VRVIEEMRSGNLLVLECGLQSSLGTSLLGRLLQLQYELFDQVRVLWNYLL